MKKRKKQQRPRLRVNHRNRHSVRPRTALPKRAPPQLKPFKPRLAVEPGGVTLEDNGHRWTWLHRGKRTKHKGYMLVARSVCIDCHYERGFPVRRELEPTCDRVAP